MIRDCGQEVKDLAISVQDTNRPGYLFVVGGSCEELFIMNAYIINTIVNSIQINVLVEENLTRIMNEHFHYIYIYTIDILFFVHWNKLEYLRVAY